MPFNFLRGLFWLLLLAGIVVGAARLTCLRWWQVPEDDPTLTTSLAPSLAPGDWVLLWRLTPPGFGDLVLCPDPGEAGQVVVGRIVGEGGDHLTVDEDGLIQINNIRQSSEGVCARRATIQVSHPRSGDPVELRCDIEILGGVHHQRARRPSAGVKPAAVSADVKPGKLFLISDNRYYPFDSRDYGAVPIESCSEAVFFRLVSRLGFSDVASRLSLVQ